MPAVGFAQIMPTYDELITQFSPLNVEAVVLNLLIAGVLGGVISAIYRWTRRDVSIPSFATTLLVLCILICVVMTTLDTGNIGAIGRGIGLFGVLSILRFRAVLDNPRDIMFVFFALAVGMAIGVGSLVVAVIATLAVGGLIATIDVIGAARNQPKGDAPWTINLTYQTPPDGFASCYQSVLQTHVSDYQIMEQQIKKDGTTAIRLLVRMKASHDPMNLLRELVALNGVEDVRLKDAA